MSKGSATNGLYDPRNGGQAIRLESLSLGRKPHEPARTNYFSVYLIETGSGTFWADASQFAFGPDAALLFFVPYQHIRFAPDAPVQGKVIQFHANFLCVETFHAEVGCSGVLFNDPYGIPVVTLAKRTKAEVMGLFDRIRSEQAERNLAYSEVMLAHLKVLLILATRLKSSTASCGPGADLRHPLLSELRDLIEQNYCTLHSPAGYAKKLHVTAKTLGRIVRENLGSTPTRPRRGPARFPILERSRKVGRQGRHHDGGRTGDDGRFGEGILAKAGDFGFRFDQCQGGTPTDGQRVCNPGAIRSRRR